MTQHYKGVSGHCWCCTVLKWQGNIDRYVNHAHDLGFSEEAIGKSLNKMAAKMKTSGRWSEAAKALRIAGAPPVALIEAHTKAGEWMNAVEVAEHSKDMSSVKSLVVDRAQTILKEFAARSEQFHSHAKRLEVVRGIKKERINNVRDGIETGGDLEVTHENEDRIVWYCESLGGRFVFGSRKHVQHS
ncbi:hypothetical protein COOONC_28676 [Cooperia oncophora]